MADECDKDSRTGGWFCQPSNNSSHLTIPCVIQQLSYSPFKLQKYEWQMSDTFPAFSLLLLANVFDGSCHKMPPKGKTAKYSEMETNRTGIIAIWQYCLRWQNAFLTQLHDTM